MRKVVPYGNISPVAIGSGIPGPVVQGSALQGSMYGGYGGYGGYGSYGGQGSYVGYGSKVMAAGPSNIYYQGGVMNSGVANSGVYNYGMVNQGIISRGPVGMANPGTMLLGSGAIQG